MDGLPYVVETLEMDQSLDTILLRESINQTLTVLPNPLYEIACYADVEGTISPACKNVYEKLLRHGEVPPGWPAVAGHDNVGGKLCRSLAKLLRCLSA